jgi:hypothetical protein
MSIRMARSGSQTMHLQIVGDNEVMCTPFARWSNDVKCVGQRVNL